MPLKIHYVVLAAGESRRMGFDKVVQRCGGHAPLERLARVLDEREILVVVPSRLQQIAAEMMPGSQIVTNNEPARGMTHSLRLALAIIAPSQPFGILLGDMPAVTHETLRRTEAVFHDREAEVAYPVGNDGTPGHPVLFAPRARSIIAELADGDTLRSARENGTLRRATWICPDRSAFLDLDVPCEWEAFADA